KQFTDRRGHGTYSFVVRSCRGAQLDPNFERGSTRLRNAMKAAVCLLDIELSQMNSEIRAAYRAKPDVLGIFPVAAYNGGGRNVAKLYRALNRMGVQLDELRRGPAHSGLHSHLPLCLAPGWIFGASSQHSALQPRK
ncbi:MAG: hypothetical protein QOF42_2190, partial [Gammaproteobacteria bacterium]|nr:hypothetical protein [Gammaproteobacteria bacterium]